MQTLPDERPQRHVDDQATVPLADTVQDATWLQHESCIDAGIDGGEILHC